MYELKHDLLMGFILMAAMLASWNLSLHESRISKLEFRIAVLESPHTPEVSIYAPAKNSVAGIICPPHTVYLAFDIWHKSNPRTEFATFMKLIYDESKCDPNTISVAGAIGLGQVMPSTAEWLIPGTGGTLTNPEVNLMVSAAYLNYLVDKNKGNVPKAIKTYKGY